MPTPPCRLTAAGFRTNLGAGSGAPLIDQVTIVVSRGWFGERFRRKRYLWCQRRVLARFTALVEPSGRITNDCPFLDIGSCVRVELLLQGAKELRQDGSWMSRSASPASSSCLTYELAQLKMLSTSMARLMSMMARARRWSMSTCAVPQFRGGSNLNPDDGRR